MAVGPQSSVNVSVNFQDSTNSLSREINRGLKGFNVQGMRGLDTAFGNITKNVRTFDTALDRANQRVILFAASASILYGTIRAFGEMAKATVDVEKSMISINSVFRLTNQQLDQFSKGLFNVALSTSQSFDKVAEAAQEFSRQGLSASETIKRTKDAMILTRLAAIDTAEAVTVLTATINGFAKEGLNSTQITNRLATVDAAFAVSTKDLVGALTRVGSAASDAGLSFNELVGLVTTAKQITGREGPVIAQALNTIFTRLNRKDTIDALDGLGVSVRDLGTGALLPTLQILQNFSSSYDQMTGTIKTQAAELVGGVRNLNTLKAVIGDLAKGNSVYSQTQQTLSQTTNQAYLRNEELNTSLEATIQRFGTINKQISANIGNVGFAGPLKTIIGGTMNNPIVDAFRDATGQAETTGGKVAEGFLKGFGGAVIFGLGPILVKGLWSVIKNTLGNLVADVALASGMTKESQAQAVIQNQIVALYGQGNAELAKQLALTTSIAERALIIRSALESQTTLGITAENQLMAEAAAVRNLGYRPRVPKGAAGGYIPGAMGAETAAIGAGVGGAPMGARPVLLPSFNFGGGKSGPLVANSSEFLVPHMAGGSAIYNRDMIRKFGLPPGATPVAAGGWVPNAAFGGLGGMTQPNAPYNIYAGNVLRNPQIVPGGAFPSAGGQGFGQYQGPAYSSGNSPAELAIKERAVLEKQKQNAEYEARILSQRKAAAEGEIKAFAEEKARVEATAYSNTKIFRGGVNKLGQPSQSNLPGEMMIPQGPESDRAAAIRMELMREANKLPVIIPQLSPQSVAETRPGLLSRIGSRLRSPMGQFGVGMGLSFAGGAIGEGKGGTTEGMIRGVAGSGLEMAGLGMQFAGPQGALVMGGIGTAYGFLSKISKSFSELAGEIDESKKKLSQELEAAVEVFRIQEKIKEAFNEGDQDAVAELQRQRTIQMSRVSPRYQKLVSDNLYEPNGMRNVLTEVNANNANTSAGFGILSALKTSDTWSGIFGGALSRKNQRGAAMEAFGPALAGLSQSELEDLQQLNRGAPHEALRRIGSRVGLDENKDFQGFVNTVGGNDIGSTSVHDTAQYGIASAINRILSRQDKRPREKDAEVEGLRKSLIDLSTQLRTQANFISITGAANQQISQIRNQIALSNPGLTDITKLQLAGTLGSQNITTQFGVQRQAEMLSGKSDLMSIMGKLGVNQSSVEAVKGISSLTDLKDMRDRLLTVEGRGQLQKLGGENSPFFKALEDLIRKLDVLNFTEQENTRANDEGNRLMMEELRFTKTYQGARREYSGAAMNAGQNLITALNRNDIPDIISQKAIESSTSNLNDRFNSGRFNAKQYQGGRIGISAQVEALNRVNADMGIRSLLAEGKGKDLTGAQIESGLMGGAQQRGMMGKSLQSFTEGFHAKFEGLKQDIKQFAEVGATVANSLEQNLGSAFGNFITGAQKGKDAFRAFVLGVLNDSARAFASKAVQGLLGMIFSSLVGGAMGGTGAVGQGISLAPGQSASGGFIGLAAGGRVPTMLTGGEYAFGPAASSRLGPSMLTGLNNGTIRKMASGGSLIRGGSGVMDDVPAMLKPGTFIVKKAMTERYGVPFLSALANGGGIGGASGSITMGMGGETTTMMSTVNPLMRAMGGNITNIFNSISSAPIRMAGGGTISAPSSYPVMPGGANVMMTSHASSMTPIRMAGGGMLPSPFQMMADGGTVTTMTTNAAGLGGGNSNTFNIGVTVNDNSSSSSSSQTSAGGASPLADRKFAELMALRMKQVALQTIEEQTRLSGMLRRQSLRST